MMNNKEIDYTARPIPGDYEGRSHRACVWYNRARAAFDLATLDTLTTAADKAAGRVPTEATGAHHSAATLQRVPDTTATPDAAQASTAALL